MTSSFSVCRTLPKASVRWSCSSEHAERVIRSSARVTTADLQASLIRDRSVTRVAEVCDDARLYAILRELFIDFLFELPFGVISQSRHLVTDTIASVVSSLWCNSRILCWGFVPSRYAVIEFSSLDRIVDRYVQDESKTIGCMINHESKNQEEEKNQRSREDWGLKRIVHLDLKSTASGGCLPCGVSYDANVLHKRTCPSRTNEKSSARIDLRSISASVGWVLAGSFPTETAVSRINTVVLLRGCASSWRSFAAAKLMVLCPTP